MLKKLLEKKAFIGSLTNKIFPGGAHDVGAVAGKFFENDSKHFNKYFPTFAKGLSSAGEGIAERYHDFLDGGVDKVNNNNVIHAREAANNQFANNLKATGSNLIEDVKPATNSMIENIMNRPNVNVSSAEMAKIQALSGMPHPEKMAMYKIAYMPINNMATIASGMGNFFNGSTRTKDPQHMANKVNDTLDTWKNTFKGLGTGNAGENVANISKAIGATRDFGKMMGRDRNYKALWNSGSNLMDNFHNMRNQHYMAGQKAVDDDVMRQMMLNQSQHGNGTGYFDAMIAKGNNASGYAGMPGNGSGGMMHGAMNHVTNILDPYLQKVGTVLKGNTEKFASLLDEIISFGEDVIETEEIKVAAIEHRAHVTKSFEENLERIVNEAMRGKPSIYKDKTYNYTPSGTSTKGTKTPEESLEPETETETEGDSAVSSVSGGESAKPEKRRWHSTPGAPGGTGKDIVGEGEGYAGAPYDAVMPGQDAYSMLGNIEDRKNDVHGNYDALFNKHLDTVKRELGMSDGMSSHIEQQIVEELKPIVDNYYAKGKKMIEGGMGGVVSEGMLKGEREQSLNDKKKFEPESELSGANLSDVRNSTIEGVLKNMQENINPYGNVYKNRVNMEDNRINNAMNTMNSNNININRGVDTAPKFGRL